MLDSQEAGHVVASRLLVGPGAAGSALNFFLSFAISLQLGHLNFLRLIGAVASRKEFEQRWDCNLVNLAANPLLVHRVPVRQI